MSRNSVRRMGIRAGIIAVVLPGIAEPQRAEVVSAATAKGIVVLRASFASRGELHSFALEISLDGQTFVDAEVGALRGLRLSDRMVKGAANGAQETVLMVPVVGRLGLGAEKFLFPEPGAYKLRWDIAFRDGEVGDLKINQSLYVKPATKPDLEFIARIGDRRFWKEVLGVDPPEGGTTELLALGVIAAALQYAEDDPGEEGSLRGELKWADAWFALAQELPDSSYAPYAGYAGGRIYRGHLGRDLDLAREQITPRAREHTMYRKAEKALTFAVEHGDAFLRPRALCSLAYLRVCSASWDEAEKYLAQAEEGAGGQGNVLRVINEMRRDVGRLKERSAGHQP